MKKLIVFINLILIITAVGQNNKRDDLWRQFSIAKDDTTKVLLLAGLGDIYDTEVSSDAAFLIGQQGLRLAESIGYIKGEMNSKVSKQNKDCRLLHFKRN